MSEAKQRQVRMVSELDDSSVPSDQFTGYIPDTEAQQLGSYPNMPGSDQSESNKATNSVTTYVIYGSDDVSSYQILNKDSPFEVNTLPDSVPDPQNRVEIKKFERYMNIFMENYLNDRLSSEVRNQINKETISKSIRNMLVSEINERIITPIMLGASVVFTFTGLGLLLAGYLLASLVTFTIPLATIYTLYNSDTAIFSS